MRLVTITPTLDAAPLVWAPKSTVALKALASQRAGSLRPLARGPRDAFAMAIDEQAVRDHAQGHLDALIAGDVDRALQDLSKELRSQPGELMAMLPLPLTAGEIETVDLAASSYTAVLHLVGETDETRLQTRWKERDERPTIVEVSHLSSGALAAGEVPEADIEASPTE
jgi:hypothetical protein